MLDSFAYNDQNLEAAESSAASNVALNDLGIPVNVACPICGKWGRRKYKYMLDSTGRLGDVKYYHCNPKARRGGAGCGEAWKPLPKVTGCDRINRQANALEAEAKQLANAVNLGYRMLELFKEGPYFDPFARKIEAWKLYQPYRDTVVPALNANGRCGCGCDSKPLFKLSKQLFASNYCLNMIYHVARMIATQDANLRILLSRLNGDKCACCDTSPHLDRPYKPCNYEGGYGLEIDHIIEVNEGGGLCWIDNLQLLCKKCHKAKTAEYAAARAAKRKHAAEQSGDQLKLF